ncbi:MAG TPA: glycoside hydrolase family 9 protein [Puia sp.]|nr:glycoside hydrolase family 9 protein [Puia sp.]
MRLISLPLLFLAFGGFAQSRAPMIADSGAAAEFRWLQKPVTASRVLDNMESLDAWSSFTTSGGAIVDARKVMRTVDSSSTVAVIGLSGDRVHQGQRALLMRTPTRLAGPGPATGRGWGRSGIRRRLEGEDWSGYNRISLWIYPDLPGFYTTALDFRVYNDGKEKLPALWGQEGETSIVLRNHEWNHIVWEIGNVARDRVTAFEASYGLSGSAPGEADTIQFYFDELSLEKVEPDKIEGWDVWPGRIAYSQMGYSVAASKTAIACGLDAKTFTLVDPRNGNIVFTGPVETESTPIGQFQVMDFSRVRVPGDYVLQCGTVATHPFRIGDDVWNQTIWKILNFLYSERCGMEVPGVHGACHRDWTCIHGDKRIVINGGWHDAGDLSQQAEATIEITYALFSLADKLRQQNDDVALLARVLEEAKWGLDWILKTSFRDGYRDIGSINSRRTDGIIGNDDDITTVARLNPMTNLEAAGAEALAWRLLKESDPRLAAYALTMAGEDWGYGIANLSRAPKAAGLFRGNFDSDNVEDELPSVAILAATELFKATGERMYADKAVGFARYVTGAQQRVLPDWDVPITGFFYTSTARDRLLHYCHRGRDQAPILALAALCRTFPGHTDFMKWYGCLALYSEYLQTIANYTAPYGVLPGSIYADTEYRHVPESRMESYREQVLHGIPLGKGHYLRLFPVWMDYRGHFGTILPQAQALAAAGQIRNDPASIDLAERQLEWVIGRNPFAASAMYGAGYDFSPLYSPSSGQMVGGLPVGIQTRGVEDMPYWPVQSTWTYKEIWGHPATNWIWLLSAIEGPALVSGRADSAVVFREAATGNVTRVTPDGADGIFSVKVSPGIYSVTSGGVTQVKELLSGTSYRLELRADSCMSLRVTKEISGSSCLIRVGVRGRGMHKLRIRGDGIKFVQPERSVRLIAGKEQTVLFHGTIESGAKPWIAQVIADDDYGGAREEGSFIK